MLDPILPAGGKAFPVPATGCMVDREHGERSDDLLERQAHSLSDPNEGDPPQDIAAEPSLAIGGPFGMNESLALVEAYGRGGQTAPRSATSPMVSMFSMGTTFP